MKKTQVNSTIQTATKDFVKKRNRKRVSIILSICLAVCAVVGVAYGVRHSGSAWNHITKEIVCEETVNLHQHTDDCYGFDEDGNEILICGYADYLVHTHNQYCYNDDNELICPLPEVEEHVHDDSCYVEEKVLICELEETDEEIIDDEIVEDEVIEDEVVEDEIINDEIVDDEIIEDEIINDELEIIDDVETPLAGLTHQHDDSCYETRKVLICGELELHTHDDDCYDEYGNLICGQLELKEHQHTEDCVIKRELTEEEIEALDKADPNAKTNLAEQIFTKTVETDEYIVTVTYNGLAEIPEEAELVVKEVELTSDQLKSVGVADSEASEASEDAEEEDKAADGAELYKALDIFFMLNGEEIEPKAEVQVDVHFKDADFDGEQEMTVTHIKDDGSTEVLGEQTVDEFSNISVTTDSFSIYVYATKGKKYGEPNEGKYKDTTFKYNNLKDAFVNDEAYAKYRRSNGALGVYASNFHIVAFDTAYTNVHTNGNILARNINGGANFGTNSYNDEISYIQNIIKTGAMETGNGSGKALVIGEANPIETCDNGNQIQIYYKDKSGSTTTGQSSATLLIKDLDTANAPFIDFNNVRAEIDSIQNGFKNVRDVNVDSRLDRNYIKITDPESCAYLNVRAADLKWKSDLKLVGFESGKQGSLIINVDCSGCDSFDIPTRAYVYFDSTFNADGTLASEGRRAATDEVTEFSGGKVIWNLINTREDMNVGITQLTGIVIAPNCNINANMMNGNIVGKNVTISGETHRTDFTGTTIPFAAQLTATKTVDGRTPNADEKFDFVLTEIVNGLPVDIQTVKNNGSNISFDKISYGKDSDVGTHWYFIHEKAGSNPRYVYDDTAYVIKTVVTKDSNNKYNATSEYFKTTYSLIDSTKNVTDKTQNSVNESELEFKNSDSTSVSVEKKWVAEDGVSELRDNLPDSITVKLMQCVDGKDDAQYKEDITLTKANNFRYTWNELPRQEASTGKAYSYYVVENPVDGFTQIISGDPVRVTDGTITLTNAKKPELTSIHVKKRFYLVENGEPKKDDSLEVTDPTLFRPGTKYPEAWEVMATLYVSPNGGQTWDQCWPEIVLGSNYDSLPDDQKIHYTTSTGETGIQKSKKASYDIHQADNWEITITGLPKSGVYNGDLGGYKGKYCDFTYKVMERMSCWSIFQYDYDNYTLNGVKKPLDNGGEVFTPDLIGGDTKYEPIVDGGITADGTYDFTLNNFGDGFIDVEILKNWYTVEGGVDSIQNGANNDAFITLELTEKVTGKKIGTYKLTKDALVEVDDNGNAVTNQKYATEALTNNHNLWSGKIKDLNKYVIKNGKLMYADYDLTEKVVSEEGDNKYVYGSYVCFNKSVDKQTDPKKWTFTFDNKNTESYELPRTGGRGTLGGLIKIWMRKFF